MMDIGAIIRGAKLGRERKDAQIDTCTVFAAALFDVLAQHGIECRMVTAVNKSGRAWAHSVVEVDGTYYDSLGEFSDAIYHTRAKLHQTVSVNIEYREDFREDCYESEFDELYAFFVKELCKSVRLHEMALA